MPRLMSVALTEQAVRERRKTVTRRLGWRVAEAGMELDLCRKVMGRQAGEPLVRIARVRVVSTRWEPLSAVTDADVYREGFTDADLRTAPWGGRYVSDHLNTPRLWFLMFFTHHMTVHPDALVTRIEWEYLDLGPCGQCGYGFDQHGATPTNLVAHQWTA